MVVKKKMYSDLNDKSSRSKVARNWVFFTVLIISAHQNYGFHQRQVPDKIIFSKYRVINRYSGIKIIGFLYNVGRPRF